MIRLTFSANMVPVRLLNLFLISLLFWATSSTCSRATIEQYADSGKTDFDTVVNYLQGFGTWVKPDKDTYAFEPKANVIPFAHGQWHYTNFGWLWVGVEPYSWVTDHYGTWKHDSGKWLWYPAGIWEPAPVELRVSGEYLGWRSSEIDQDGNFKEPNAVRYAKTDEWVFVTLSQFTTLLNPTMLTPADKVADLLDDSTPSIHTYITYRPIARIGPHPADLLKYMTTEGMLPPLTLEDRLELQREAALNPLPVGPSQSQPTVSPTPKPTPKPTPPSFTFTDPATTDLSPPLTVPHKVKVWLLMSLPSMDSTAPATAKRDEIYIFRPDFYQDADGIQRRILLVLHPELRTDEATRIQQALKDKIVSDSESSDHPRATPKPSTSTPVPAQPVH